MNSEAFRLVYEAVVHGRAVEPGELLEECIEAASKNKVLLEFLRAAGVQGRLRALEEARYRLFLEALHLVSRALRGLNYVFFKLRKPARYVPSDIDVLVDPGDAARARRRLERVGFRVEVLEPYTITMRRGRVIVDLYTYPTVGGVVYLDGPRLLEYRELGVFEGLEIPLLERPLEALVAAAHAVYKERLYTLNDYVTLARWGSRTMLRLAEELGCSDAVREALRIHSMVYMGGVLPYRIPLARWLLLLLRKASRDAATRATLPNIARAFEDPRFGELVRSKLLRETY
ncbi:hypothetical protein CF15_08190 [Pyrodictium occultum]|uniref:Nucleotidyltransferase family protein n=1 Tax=Pyrodictium occultum TaxID=2309 RepID=A0A0V8RRM8_PYROC|nr:nucleotidyltransferase family protein [Pyrodictium occultum]KSW10751.1 hypothetical protein CF15_08190 [Pyrodictium occultum]